MAVKSLNIEIGDQLVKVCRITHKGKEVRITDAFIFQTPAACVSDGVIEDPQTLALRLKEELAAHGLQGINAVNFALSSGKIAVREVKLPPVKPKQIAAIVQTNAEEYFPVDLKNYYVTHSILDTVAGQEPFCRVLVMAAPLKLLEGYFKLADLAGLNVLSIDTSGNSHYQALRGISGKGVTIYADVDCSTSVISFMQGDKLLLQRTFSFGGDELISHYMSLADKKADKYLDALWELDVRNPAMRASEFLHTEDVQGDLNRLIGSIARSADYFNSSQWELQADKIILMGPCRHLVGLCELMSNATGLETIYLDEVSDFGSMVGGASDAPAYISCIGCAIAPVDLMPDRFAGKGKSKKKDESLTPGIVICIALVALAATVSVLSILKYVGASKALKDMEQEITNLQYAEDTYNTYLAYQQGQEAVTAISQHAQQPNSKLVEFCEELESKMPTSILLLSAVCTNEGVSMNVTVGSYPETAVVLKQLRSFESLSTVEISSVTRSVNEAGIERISFSLNCAYGVNPYLNGINPYSELVAPEASAETTEAPAETPAE